jgi:hypothetical protein
LRPIIGEETFGAVAPKFRFKTEEEATSLANDTEFGLASYFYSRDISRVMRVAEALEHGIVGINEGLISTEVAPFGGVKESGLWPRGLKVRHRGLSRVEVSLPGRNCLMKDVGEAARGRVILAFEAGRHEVGDTGLLRYVVWL